MKRAPAIFQAQAPWPTSGEGRELLAGSATLRANQESSDVDFATVSAENKRFSTLRAHLAMKGFTLVRLQSGCFLIGRWDRTRDADSLEAVEAFFASLGVRRG